MLGSWAERTGSDTLMAAHTTLVSGTQILRTVREDLARYRTRIQPHQRQVTIVRFETGRVGSAAVALADGGLSHFRGAEGQGL